LALGQQQPQMVQTVFSPVSHLLVVVRVEVLITTEILEVLAAVEVVQVLATTLDPVALVRQIKVMPVVLGVVLDRL
jgi:hypothetical protein